MTNEQESAAAASHDIFKDPALVQTVQDDPLYLLLKKWWVHIVVVAAAVVLGVYAKGVFEETARAELMRASDIFIELESRFDELPALEAALAKAQADAAQAADKQEDARAKVTEAQSALDQANARMTGLITSLEETAEPYNALGRIYRGALAARSGNHEAARNALSTDRWTALKAEKTSDRFLAELEALILARAELDDAARLSAARANLRALAEAGVFVAVPAAVALASSSSSTEEKAEATAVIENLKTKYPEQIELLDSALSREL